MGAVDEQELTRWLTERGGHATTAVELPGEFSLRGGIFDIFAPDAEDPVRVELFGDEVESIRRFDVATQRSLETLQSTTVTMLEPTASDRAHFTSYLPGGGLESAGASFGETRLRGSAWFMLIEPGELQEEGKFYLERMDRPGAFHAVRPTMEEIYKFPSVTASGVPAGSMETTAHLEFESVERFSGDISKVRDELDKVSAGQEVFVVAETEAEIERLTEVFSKGEAGGGGEGGALAEPVAREEGELRGLEYALPLGTWRRGFGLCRSGWCWLVRRNCFSGRIWRAPRGGGRRGRLIRSWSCARATWSFTWRMESGGIAGCGCWSRRGGPRSIWSSSTTAARRSMCRARRSSSCRSMSAARARGLFWRTSAARRG